MKYKGFYCFPSFIDSEKVYVGSVEDTPEIDNIEAATMEEFETLFHQAVDEHIRRTKESKSKKKVGLVITVVSFVLLLLAMVVSCPKKSQHSEALTDLFTSYISDEMGDDNELQALGILFGGPISNLVVKNYLDVKDYVLFSLGEFAFDGKTSVVTVGVLGHVFTISKEKFAKVVNQSGVF